MRSPKPSWVFSATHRLDRKLQMSVDRSALTTIEGLQAALHIAAFHRWLGLDLVSASPAGIVIAMPWRDDLVSQPGRQDRQAAERRRYNGRK